MLQQGTPCNRVLLSSVLIEVFSLLVDFLYQLLHINIPTVALMQELFPSKPWTKLIRKKKSRESVNFIQTILTSNNTNNNHLEGTALLLGGKKPPTDTTRVEINYESQNRDEGLKAIVRSCWEAIKNWSKYLGQRNSNAANSSQSIFSITASALLTNNSTAFGRKRCATQATLKAHWLAAQPFELLFLYCKFQKPQPAPSHCKALICPQNKLQSVTQCKHTQLPELSLFGQSRRSLWLGLIKPPKHFSQFQTL